MGYELNPKNKKIESISVGSLSWPMFLQETGMGYVLGYGTAMKAASYVYQQGNNGSPVSNDGYTVTAPQAKMSGSRSGGGTPTAKPRKMM